MANLFDILETVLLKKNSNKNKIDKDFKAGLQQFIIII